MVILKELKVDWGKHSIANIKWHYSHV